MAESYGYPEKQPPTFGEMLQAVIDGKAIGWYVLKFEDGCEVPDITYEFEEGLTEEAAQELIVNQNDPNISYRHMTPADAQAFLDDLQQDEEGWLELQERGHPPDGEDQ